MMVVIGRSPEALVPSRESSESPTSFLDWFSPCVSPLNPDKGPLFGPQKRQRFSGSSGGFVLGPWL